MTEQYKKIDYMGNTLYSDKFVQLGSFVYMISLFGTPDMVKAATSAILNKQEVMVEGEPLTRMTGVHYSVMQKKVGQGIVHGILFQKDTMVIENISTVTVLLEPSPKKFYDIIDSKYPTPMLPSMAEELYDYFVVNSPTRMDLRTFGYSSAVEIELPSQEELEAKVLDLAQSETVLQKAS